MPLMKAAIRMPAPVQVGVTSIPIDVSAEYLSGGAASGLPVTLRSQVQPNATVSISRLREFHLRQRRGQGRNGHQRARIPGLRKRDAARESISART